MTRRIIQFGTSRFLQAHVDLFVHEARQAGQDVGPIAVVQASGSPARAGRVAAFGRPEGYPVVIRGLEAGQPVERTVTVTSVDRGLSAARDWEAVIALFATEAETVVSNMGDAGYAVDAADRTPALLQSAGVPVSFAGKLTVLLWRRWEAGGAKLVMLPCELINRNGAVLRDTVTGLAREAEAPADFVGWLNGSVIWANTLVDRIVSEPIEPVGAVAEPYALWAIERQPGLEPPCLHPAIVMADDLDPFERLKLHILNLGHTVLADIWMEEARDKGETVRAILGDAEIRARLETLYEREVIPGFAARGSEAAAISYVGETMDRFRNPFLDHRIADIAQNHALKVERRIAAFLAWVAAAGRPASAPTLDAIVARNRRDQTGKTVP
ncbi:MAG: mannitol dehydrogenase family protein [Acetobacteraceae bacterium]|nr:mannitol dehydrogenase family protein [Acetobacteraceae bacterium]